MFNWGFKTIGQSTGSVGENGFISMRSGTFMPDPAGKFDDQGNGLYKSEQAPPLNGDISAATYDRPYRRWLPTSVGDVLADGSAYVYELELPDGSAYEVHLVQVASGIDTVIDHMPYDAAYGVVAFRPEGIYMAPIIHRSGLTGGLWLFDPTSKLLKSLPASTEVPWGVSASGVAWTVWGPGPSLMRLDIATGVVTTWFQHATRTPEGPGNSNGLFLIGFDSESRPLVEVFPPVDTSASPTRATPVEVWLVSAPGQATQLTGIAVPDYPNPLEGGVTDSHGLWLVGADGIYLYDRSGFHRKAPLAPQPTPNYWIEGDCG